METTKHVIGYAIIAAFSGFLFGFDMVVISGADQSLQLLWKSSSLFHGLVVMSMALWGTVLGSIYGHIPVNRIGRKNSLILLGILFGVSAIGSALAQDPYTFAIARFLGGLGIGISTIAAPAYISEIAPSEHRGKLVGLYQLNIVVGILSAYLSNYYFATYGENAWRWMLGVQFIPALIFTIGSLFLKESKRWGSSEGNTKNKPSLLSPSMRRVFWLTFFVAFFNQFSGINAFLYYAPRIFELANLSQEAGALSSIGAGLVNLIFTILGLSLIDRFGRKKLLWYGGIGYVVSLGLVSFYFLLDWQGPIVSYFFFLFIAAHAIGQGAVIWVFISELFPDALRAKGQAFGSTVHWILAACIPALMPFLFEAIGAGYVFAFFTFMMLVQLIWIRVSVPETKGKSLDELQKELSK